MNVSADRNGLGAWKASRAGPLPGYAQYITRADTERSIADVEKHPEHRKFVFPERPTDNQASSSSNDPPGLFTKDGKLKNPERSIYYDPVFNPYGAPPPGMPYRERREPSRFAGYAVTHSLPCSTDASTTRAGYIPSHARR